jgi:hypothetical protein
MVCFGAVLFEGAFALKNEEAITLKILVQREMDNTIVAGDSELGINIPHREI